MFIDTNLLDARIYKQIIIENTRSNKTVKCLIPLKATIYGKNISD
jgi:hypothetical protein